MPLGVEVGLGPGDFVFDVDPATPRKKGTPTQFLANVYCGHGRPSQLLLSSCFAICCDAAHCAGSSVTSDTCSKCTIQLLKLFIVIVVDIHENVFMSFICDFERLYYGSYM